MIKPSVFIATLAGAMIIFAVVFGVQCHEYELKLAAAEKARAASADQLIQAEQDIAMLRDAQAQASAQASRTRASAQVKAEVQHEVDSRGLGDWFNSHLTPADGSR